MKKCLILAVATLVAAGVVFGALGSVVRSFPIPGGYCGGLARSDTYLYVNNYSQARIYRVNPTSGSVYDFWTVGSNNCRGLAYQYGGYLWLNKAPSPSRIFKMRENTGSIYNYYSLPTIYSHGSAPLATGDGGRGTSVIFISDYYTRRIHYMATGGSIFSSFTVSRPLFDIAYDWRNRLIWGGMNSTTVYGFTATGSLKAYFNKPIGNIYGITYYGQYLWVAGSTGLIYQIHCPSNVGIAPTSMGKIKAIFE
jgi:hypothetical protein